MFSYHISIKIGKKLQKIYLITPTDKFGRSIRILQAKFSSHVHGDRSRLGVFPFLSIGRGLQSHLLATKLRRFWQMRLIEASEDASCCCMSCCGSTSCLVWISLSNNRIEDGPCSQNPNRLNLVDVTAATQLLWGTQGFGSTFHSSRVAEIEKVSSEWINGLRCTLYRGVVWTDSTGVDS